ncbi:hypothetical protein J6W20_04860 [bacterium]|nr:hypothetical protein [bacterium]
MFIIYACYKEISVRQFTINGFIQFIDLNFTKFNELCNIFFVNDKVDIIN